MPDDSNSVIVLDPNGGPPDVQTELESIRALLETGQSVHAIAQRLNLDPAKVLAVSGQLARTQTADGGERLKDYADKLDELIQIAHWNSKAEPTPNNLYAYAAVVKEARAVLQDMDVRRDPAKLNDLIVDKVLEPMLVHTIQVMTAKLAGIKAELSQIVPVDRHEELTHQIDGAMRALGTTMKDELAEAKESLEKVVFDRPDKTAALAKRKR